ncbi:acyl carrier protein [Methanobrevibacter ruminantium]|uniref:acyl carrier protein n=1 Tax=Methanobrevibacter ruminantium TaxID=83816 RepID=UPI0026ECD15D|nr:acyl carrier protein [Methanobrevibacter ruminantium]
MKKETTIEEVVKLINEVIDECFERKERNSEGEKEQVSHIGIEDYDKDIREFGIDSLGYIRLIILLEGYFDFEFSDEDITSHTLRSALDFYTVILNYS